MTKEKSFKRGARPRSIYDTMVHTDEASSHVATSPAKPSGPPPAAPPSVPSQAAVLLHYDNPNLSPSVAETDVDKFIPDVSPESQGYLVVENPSFVGAFRAPHQPPGWRRAS